MALELTDANFEVSTEEKDKLVMIDFWAAWCGPCRMLSPVVEELAKDYEGKVIVGKMDVDTNPVISRQYGIRSLPTILFLKNGEVVDKQVGLVPKGKLIEKIEANLDAEKETEGESKKLFNKL